MITHKLISIKLLKGNGRRKSKVLGIKEIMNYMLIADAGIGEIEVLEKKL